MTTDQVSTDQHIEQSRRHYEKAIFTGDTSLLTVAEAGLDAVEAALALARGRIRHGWFLAQRETDPDRARPDPAELALFERAAHLYRENGDPRGAGEALFWLGCYHQVAAQNDAKAVPLLERSLELATEAGDQATRAEALRHLGVAAFRAGRLPEARRHLEESARLRREAGALASVAANLVGLIYIAIAEGRRDDAQALAQEALALAEAAGATVIARQVAEARAAL